MVLIENGISDVGAHVCGETGNFICLTLILLGGGKKHPDSFLPIMCINYKHNPI